MKFARPSHARPLQRSGSLSPGGKLVRGLLVLINLLVALACYVLEPIYPLHGLLVLIFIYFAYRNLKRLVLQSSFKDSVVRAKKTTSRFTFKHKALLVVVIMVVSVWYAIVSTVPTDKQVFTGRDTASLLPEIDQDVEESTVLLDMLMLSGEKLMTNPALTKKELTQEETASLKKDWEEFLVIAQETEVMTDKHKYFAQISLFKNKPLQEKSFTIAYALYIKKFEIFHKVIEKVSNNQTAITVFNEYSDTFGVRGLYDDVTTRFFASNSFLRRNLGYLYYKTLVDKEDPLYSPNYRTLLFVSQDSYRYLFKNMLSHITHRSVTYKHSIDKKAFETWLPIQKTVITDKIGNVHVGDRKTKFITVKQIETMKKKLQPGDILVYRKNWYASNLGIPGFWTHAGLYTGTLEEMNAYFADVFPYKGYATFEDFLKAENSKVFSQYLEKDTEGYLPSVVESQTKGTFIQSIEVSAHVDYLGVLRPNVSKEQKLVAIVRGLNHNGKPYDYGFDLATKSEIYCSELVYDAYLDNTSGITFPKTIISGKEIVIPNAIIEKFVKEKGSGKEELSFAYFLDASEQKKEAFVSSEKGILSTVLRSKYSSTLK